MKNNFKRFGTTVIALAITWIAVGCNVGMTAAGPSDSEMKSAFDKLPLEERAKSIMSSPATMEFKKQRITEMYAKEGKEVPADLFSKASAAH